MDHVKSEQVEVVPLYVDPAKQFYPISLAQLYSNTPADFDFKLKKERAKLDETELKQFFRSVDLVFPVIHGAFGEDGELQELLEKYSVPFVSHSSAACKQMFPKHKAAELLQKQGFATLPQVVITNLEAHYSESVARFFQCHHLKRAIVKPAVGGSSIGVYSVSTPEEACLRLKEIFDNGLATSALVEPFCHGKEFTVVVFQSHEGNPVALLPTEIELSYEKNEIFNFRKKYLPTNQAEYHTPPRFSQAIVNDIRVKAETIFNVFEMRDFVRLDGWLLEDGRIVFTDINPISGLEQNSFFFRQASILGMDHRQSLEYIIKNACSRYGLNFPRIDKLKVAHPKLPVFVLFGSHNAERQVSLMSGTNVWLKLLQSQHHAPTPFFYDPHGGVWELPYSITLNHTVEEVYSSCANVHVEKGIWKKNIQEIQERLGIAFFDHMEPRQMQIDQFLRFAKQKKAFVFIAMHGGEGEDGTLQRSLETYRIPFNGSSAKISSLCMDKYLTGQVIAQLKESDIVPLPKKSVCLSDFEHCSKEGFESLWKAWTKELHSERLIIKPRNEGCSAGILSLQSAAELELYCHFIFHRVSSIPPHSFPNQSEPIEMSTRVRGDYLLEPYIETDKIVITDDGLHCTSRGGWVELTVGVLEQAGSYHAFNPSITVAEGAVLSLEEKFQGGTGVNLTPPPEEMISPAAVAKIKRLVEKMAIALGIQNYARLDLFFNRLTEKLILIEANTLPGLTPSTVFYHQGLAEEPSLHPLALLDRIILSKLRGDKCL